MATGIIKNIRVRKQIYYKLLQKKKYKNNKKESKKDTEKIEELANKIKTKKVKKSIREVAEEFRVMPNGTPFEGRYDASLTPYMIEPMFELSSLSATEIIVFMKPAQIGGTANTAENRILYEIMDDPGPLLYVTATDELAKDWSEKRLEPMLDLSGAMERIKPAVDIAKKRTTGNTIRSKTYIGGGFIHCTSYNKAGSLRMTSFRTVILDEVDAAPVSVGKEGDPRKIAEARTTAYEGRKKVLILSTPLIKQTSKVEAAYLEGDQRQYFVPCPFCGHLQKLTWRGIKYTVDEHDKLDVESVHYECEKCKGKIKNYHKSEMLVCEELGGKAKWIAQNRICKSGIASFQMGALYAPIGMITWEKLAQEWIETKHEVEKLRSFVNLRLGETFEERGESPKLQQVITLKSNYRRGTVPDDVLFATLGCDVQKGTEDGRLPPRIECELLGYGRNGMTWSIDYYILTGSVNESNSGAFKKLKNKIIENDFPIQPGIVLIDAGYNTDIVYDFCMGASSIFPCMGDGYIKGKMYREKKIKEFSLVLYQINDDLYKERIYNRLKLVRDIEGRPPNHYQSFPFDYEQNYFKMLTAEERYEKKRFGKVIGYEWRKTYSGQRNESLDIRVYNFAAFDIFIEKICEMYEVDVDYDFFWKLCEKEN